MMSHSVQQDYIQENILISSLAQNVMFVCVMYPLNLDTLYGQQSSWLSHRDTFPVDI